LSMGTMRARRLSDRAASTLCGRSRSGASSRWARVASSVILSPEARPSAAHQLFAPPHEPRLCGCHGHSRERGDLGYFVTEGVVHQDRVRLLRLHRRENVLDLFDVGARLELLLERRVVRYELCRSRHVFPALEQRALANAAPERIDANVPGNRGG